MLVAWGTGALSLLLPFVGLLSSATVALVTLRNGSGYGVKVSALAGLGCMVLCTLLLGSPWPALAVVLLSAGIMQRDGWFVLAGYAVLFATVVYFAALAGGTWLAGAGLRGIFGGPP